MSRREDSRAVAPLNDDVDLRQTKALYKISDDAGTLRLSKVKEDDELSTDDVNDDDLWAVAVGGCAYFYIGAAASREERVAVRMHAPAILEAMKLPRFAPSAVVSVVQRILWDTIFSA